MQDDLQEFQGANMMIGERLQVLREEKNLSQGDIEKRTGLLRCYVSRVENGHTVPSIETLEKMARALEMPLYHLLYDGDKPPQERNGADDNTWGNHGKDARFMHKMCGCLSRMSAGNRNLLMGLAENMTKRKKSKKQMAAST
jgi:transcriptional regulator with XRE-family HTH domain